MNENLKWIVPAAAVVGLSIGAIFYFYPKNRGAPPSRSPSLPNRRHQPSPEEPAVKHPLPVPDMQEPLPTLDESDQPMQNALAAVIGQESVERFVITKDLVRHIVVSIDNLPEQKWPSGFGP